LLSALWRTNLFNIKSPSFREWENELNKGNTRWWWLCQRMNGQDCSLIGRKSYGLNKRLWMAKKGISCIGEWTLTLMDNVTRKETYSARTSIV
jgi:hypothetical protein